MTGVRVFDNEGIGYAAVATVVTVAKVADVAYDTINIPFSLRHILNDGAGSLTPTFVGWAFCFSPNIMLTWYVFT